jgi:hypothetical protein
MLLKRMKETCVVYRLFTLHMASMFPVPDGKMTRTIKKRAGEPKYVIQLPIDTNNNNLFDASCINVLFHEAVRAGVQMSSNK